MTPYEQSLASYICICRNINCTIAWGTCHCGCGELTLIARKGNSRDGYTQGLPVAYVHGHNRRAYRVNLSNAAPFKIEGGYCRLIPLTLGQYTIVDAEVYDWLAMYAWLASGCATGGFYATRNARAHEKINGTVIRMHREIMGVSPDDDIIVDHKDPWNKLDNRRSNLRIATITQNSWNHRKLKSNTSGYKGVWWNKRDQTFLASIRIGGKRVMLGKFADPKVAHQAYKEAAIKHRGEFARFE